MCGFERRPLVAFSVVSSLLNITSFGFTTRMVTQSKINKKKISTDPLKVRSEREIVFNTRSQDGKLLTPNEAFVRLREERAVLLHRIEKGGETTHDIITRYGVVEKELGKFENFRACKARRAKRYRLKKMKKQDPATLDILENEESCESTTSQDTVVIYFRLLCCDSYYFSN